MFLAVLNKFVCSVLELTKEIRKYLCSNKEIDKKKLSDICSQSQSFKVASDSYLIDKICNVK